MSTQQVLQVGSEVILVVPENPRLNGKPAIVTELTPWGANVACPFAATGRFRAMLHEMEMVEASTFVVSKPDTQTAQKLYKDTHIANGEKTDTKKSILAKNMGYSGNTCADCGGSKMRRNGTCEICEDCGRTSGCS